jgi:3-methyladenine DNA glycosylase AlkD
LAPSLLHIVRAELSRAADPSRAPGMQAYMKSALPYHGVSAVPFRQLCRRLFADLTFADADEWQRAVLALWRGARFREERYAAVELSGHRRARPFQTLATLPMYEEMIVTGAWWDYVDHLASNRLGLLLAREPEPMKKRMRAWSRDENMWKRRSAIICQLKRKRDTDLELLYDCIAPSLSSKEFFLRKAIGWALRQYAWTDPDEVARYVRAHEHQLSPLSRREALKNIDRPRRRAAVE